MGNKKKVNTKNKPQSVLGLWSRHRLRFVLGVHLLLVSFATLGRWSHMSLLVHYLVFLVSLIWALALPQSEEAVLLCLVLNLLSVLLDIIALSIHFPSRLFKEVISE